MWILPELSMPMQTQVSRTLRQFQDTPNTKVTKAGRGTWMRGAESPSASSRLSPSLSAEVSRTGPLPCPLGVKRRLSHEDGAQEPFVVLSGEFRANLPVILEA